MHMFLHRVTRIETTSIEPTMNGYSCGIIITDNDNNTHRIDLYAETADALAILPPIEGTSDIPAFLKRQAD